MPLFGFAASEAMLVPQAELAQLYAGMAAVGADRVRIAVYWQLLEPTKGSFTFTSSGAAYPGASLDQAVDVAEQYGLKPLLCFGAQPGIPFWSYAAADYGAAVAQLVARYGHAVTEWEVWNEPNGPFWGTTPDPAAYTGFLNAAYQAVHAAQPDGLVLVGGLAPFYPGGTTIDPVSFLQGVYAAGGQFDAVANHPYSTTAAFTEEQPTAGEHFMAVDAQLAAVLAAHGDAAKPLYWTEWGFSTLQVTEAQQASWLAAQWALRGAWDGPAYLYTFHDYSTSTTDPNNGFGIVNFDWTPKPAYTWAKTLNPPGGTLQGLDYAAGRPSGADIKAAGYQFVCRYLSDGGSSLPGKLLLPSEAADLQANGIAIVSNWESTGTTAQGGYNAGVSDAQAAIAAATAAGMPAGRPIYFSIDWDATPEDQTPINAYFQGVASVIGLAATGIYGGYWPVSRALDAGVVTWAWQTQAWSGGNQDPRINLLQNNNAGFAYVDGVQCDIDESITADFGQWPIAAPTPPPPTPTPTPLTEEEVDQILAALATLQDTVDDIQIQLRGVPGPNGTFTGWEEQLGTNQQGAGLTPVDALSVTEGNTNSIGAFVAQIKANTEAIQAGVLELGAELGQNPTGGQQ